ncbi:hypothetical protein EVAR_86658_1 [Eumeta japonica]|uniref:Uncharacterized protein n=1 Tax=Eumeta variegata TaxID=151549 RepID=A0A4C1ZA47_EUMVA|nr:hypothetical protein EVAR_86658_1 [Eumeta japonica]
MGVATIKKKKRKRRRSAETRDSSVACTKPVKKKVAMMEPNRLLRSGFPSASRETRLRGRQNDAIRKQSKRFRYKASAVADSGGVIGVVIPRLGLCLTIATESEPVLTKPRMCDQRHPSFDRVERDCFSAPSTPLVTWRLEQPFHSLYR